VQGMLAGIGLIIVLGQVYAMADVEQPGSGLSKLAGLPGLAVDIVTNQEALTAFGLGAGTIAVLLVWPKLPAAVRTVPAPLAAVALATAVAFLAGLRPAVADVNGLLRAVDLPGGAEFARLADVAVIGTVLAFALIASAESLFSAAAVDRMHDGPRT
ncbi:SulP family inorganic anion transporter, partial [Streptomyces sp. DH12]